MFEILGQLRGLRSLAIVAAIAVPALIAGLTFMGVRRGAPRNHALASAVLDAALVVALVGVLAVTLTPAEGDMEGLPRVYLLPLIDVWQRLNSVRGGPTELVNVLGNLVLLAPLGFLAPLRFPSLDGLGRIVVAAAVLSTAIEITQYVLDTGRTADINDVLFNTLSGALGYAALGVARRLVVSARADHQHHSPH